nr:MAG TPA: hypothetical protein [Caudoviricetes sp.]
MGTYTRYFRCIIVIEEQVYTATHFSPLRFTYAASSDACRNLQVIPHPYIACRLG